MIRGINNLCDLFSILHDGIILRHRSVASNLELEVKISYLAQRVNSQYHGFRVVLLNVRDICFTTWPSSLTSEKEQITSMADIFAPKLHILGCEFEKDALKIICNQPSPNWNYCGGELVLKADAAVVTDEGGKEYSIEELGRICDEYWNQWQKNTSSPPLA